MKIKFFMILLCGLFTLTTFSLSAQLSGGSLEFTEGEDENGPRSLSPRVSGVISYTDNTISIDFLFVNGTVTTQIINANGELCGSYNQAISFEGNQLIDIANLPAGNYQIICYIPNSKKRFIANFTL